MELKTAYQDVQSEGIETSKTMQIGDNPVIWRFLTDQLYTQKNAWIREYAQNARDVDPNWRIVLPSLHSTECQFIDNGGGMSKEFMLNQFCQAGFSTKRNDNKSSGGFGIGRLSGPQGTIIECRNEDAIRTWALVKNKNSIPSVSLLTEEPRPKDVKLGTTVRIPVKPAEIESVKSDVFKFLRFFKLPGLPEVKYVIERPSWAIVDKPQDYSAGENPTLVEVGGYTFPVKWNDISSAATHIRDSGERDLLQKIYTTGYGGYLVLHVPIGSVSIALNRESIKFDEDTVNTLLKAAITVREELLDTINADFKAIKTTWDAKLKWRKLQSNGLNGLFEIIKKKIVWNGKTIDNHYYAVAPELRVSTENYSGRRRKDYNNNDLPQNVRPPKREGQHEQHVHPRPADEGGVTIVALDTEDAVSRRLRAKFTRKSEVWYVWPPMQGTIPKPPKDWWQPFLDLIDGEDGDGYEFVKLSEITPLPVTPRTPAALGVPRTNMVRNKFFRMVDSYVTFEPVDLDLSDPDPQVWVPFHRDDLEPGDTQTKLHKPWHEYATFPNSSPSMSNIMPSIHAVRQAMPNQRIIGVPRSQRGNVPSHWIHVLDFVRQSLPDRKLWGEILLRHQGTHVADDGTLHFARTMKSSFEKWNSKHPLLDFLSRGEADIKRTNELKKHLPVMRLFDIPVTTTMKATVTLHDFQKEYKDLIESSPALSIMSKCDLGRLTPSEKQFLVEKA